MVNPLIMPGTAKRKDRGFSLIELLLVLAIMMIISATAVPSYLAARARANEAAAASSIRAVMSAQNLYRNTYGQFADLADLGADYLTDQRLASGQKGGYYFDSAPGSRRAYEFTVTAEPLLSVGPNASGRRCYYGDETAVVRFNMTGPADLSSPPMN
jgi:type IV pilus assembly protein PilA